MDFQVLQKRGLEIRETYNQLNQIKGNSRWGLAEYTQGFVGDVGDLVKLVMAKNNYRHIDNVNEKIVHEVADCLWSLIVLSNELNIDLEQAFVKTMNKLEEKISKST